MDQAHQFPFKPDRHHDLAGLLLPLQFSANPAQVVHGFIGSRRRRITTPEIRAVDLRGDRLEHGGQVGGLEFIEVAAHQRQAQPELVISPQARHGPAHFAWIQTLVAIEATEEAQDVDCLLYTSPSPRDATLSRMPSSA